MVSGGYWQDKATGEWVRASPAVRQHIAEHPIDAGLLGVAREKSALPGNMTLPPLPPRVRGRPPPHHPVISWAQPESSRLQPSFHPLAGQWHSAASVVTLNGDSAPVGAEVIIKSDAQHNVSAPRPADAYNIDASRAEGPTTAGSNAAQPRHSTVRRVRCVYRDRTALLTLPVDIRTPSLPLSRSWRQPRRPLLPHGS